MSREQIENAKNKSINKDQIRVIKRKKKLARAFLVTAITGMLIGGSVHALSSNIHDNIEISQILEETNEYGEKLVNSNTHRTADNKGYYYAEEKIAEGLLEDPTMFDANLYGVYGHIGYSQVNRMEEMDKVMYWVKLLNKDENLVTYDKFEDYYRQKGFVDKEGNFDAKSFRKNAAELIEAQEILNSSSYKGANK